MLFGVQGRLPFDQKFQDEFPEISMGNLKYPKPLVETTIKQFVERRISTQEPRPSPDVPSETVKVVLPFKDQSSANYVKQQLNNLSSKLNITVQPVFVSPKLEQQLMRHEFKPPIVNQQCLVYEFKVPMKRKFFRHNFKI